jgi:hypothetical protein
MLAYNNKDYNSLTELAKEVNISTTTILKRLNDGMSIEEAVSKGKASCKKLIIDGIYFESINAAAKHFNILPGTLSSRITNGGWSPEEAVGLKKRVKQEPKERKTTPIAVEGIEYPSTFAAARAYNFKPQLITKRLNKGLTIEQALEVSPFPDWFVPGKGQFGIVQKQKRLEKEKITGLKKCSCCKKEKPLSCFHGKQDDKLITRCRDCISSSFLMYRYKLTEKEFWQLCLKQDTKCAICKKELNIQKGTTWREKTVAVDHCHASGKVRGILCGKCNSGLGMFNDNVDFLFAAIQYLKMN